MKKTWELQSQKKLIDPSVLEKKISEIKKEGKTIVSLNGSFDLLHAGHLQIIYEASLQGDILIVALNTDESIKKYKSVKRPIIPLKYRLLMIAALEFVDYVTYFEETDPCNILSKIKPDVHVNGREYGENCIEAATVKKYGGKIHIVDLIPSLSTTNIIEKIKCE
jgi:D-glycero-beta-D-manno-heptose 1-phosphate adenylyltransferase